jgi:hypothetical protein
MWNLVVHSMDDQDVLSGKASALYFVGARIEPRPRHVQSSGFLCLSSVTQSKLWDSTFRYVTTSSLLARSNSLIILQLEAI